ncbi:hypothetical protein Dimus_037678 [Dionaea muscipula]
MKSVDYIDLTTALRFKSTAGHDVLGDYVDGRMTRTVAFVGRILGAIPSLRTTEAGDPLYVDCLCILFGFVRKRHVSRHPLEFICALAKRCGLRSGFDHQAASSDSRGEEDRFTSRGGWSLSSETLGMRVSGPTDGRHDGTANVGMAPDVYARFQEFRESSVGRWERFLRFSGFVRCGSRLRRRTGSGDGLCATTPPLLRVVPAVAHFDEARGGLLTVLRGPRPPRLREHRTPLRWRLGDEDGRYFARGRLVPGVSGLSCDVSA